MLISMNLENIFKKNIIATTQNDVGILLISNRPVFLSIANEIMILKRGSVVEYGHANDVLSKMMPT